MAEDLGFRINATFAKQYEEKKKKEELSRLKEKYGDDFELEDDESSSSELEDDDARGITKRNERDFLKTLSLLKSKDPRLQDKNFKLYESEEEESDGGDDLKEHMSRPVRLRDFEREQLLKKGSLAGVEDGSDAASEDAEDFRDLTYNEEQRQLKENLKKVLAGEEDEQDEKEPLLKLRRKSEKEKRKEEENYLEWLKGNQKAQVDKKVATDLSALQQFWTNPLIEQDEKFLRDYILNRGYVEEGDVDAIPTYEEVTATQHDSEDEEAVEEQEEFERKYNFRFEEPGGTALVSYPRTIPGSVRQDDDSRKKKRKERDERKVRQKEEKKEELKRLKNLKKKDIMEKLEKIKEITGNETVGFDEDALDREFSPEEYDKMMQDNFDEEYYGLGEEDAEKPVFEINEGIDDYGNWDDWGGGDDDDGYHVDDSEFNMDAEYEPTEEGCTLQKNANKFAKALWKKKPTFDPKEQKFEDYFDEYYQLDYEDMVGGVPCRFKYRNVLPNDFGLSVDEILKCDPKELNKWASLKKAVQYRSKDEELRDIKKYRKKGRNAKAKERILSIVETEREDDDDDDEGNQSAVKEKKKKTSKEKQPSKGRKVAKSKAKKGLSEKRLKAYGITKKRKKKTKTK
eukprot:m.14620 g.14620  ORF g.14620 m.14620 type:complete len:627 (+) comp25852_c0_seq1:22-1902(+)